MGYDDFTKDFIYIPPKCTLNIVNIKFPFLDREWIVRQIPFNKPAIQESLHSQDSSSDSLPT